MMGYKISENLQIGHSGNHLVFQCGKCGNFLSAIESHWKDSVPRLISPLSKAGPRRSTSGRFEMREYICPKCATVLDVEVALPGDEPLYDEIDVKTLPKDV